MLIESSGYLVLAAVLGVSGALKLAQPRTAAADLARYGLFPRAMAGAVAAGLAAAEAGCAALLVVPATRRAGLLAAGALIVAFLAAMTSALARGRRIPCGCFGGRGELDVVGPPALLRTGLLGVVVLAALPGAAAPFQPAQVLVAALLVALIFLLAELTRLLPGGLAGAVR